MFGVLEDLYEGAVKFAEDAVGGLIDRAETAANAAQDAAEFAYDAIQSGIEAVVAAGKALARAAHAVTDAVDGIIDTLDKSLEALKRAAEGTVLDLVDMLTSRDYVFPTRRHANYRVHFLITLIASKNAIDDCAVLVPIIFSDDVADERGQGHC